MPESKPKSILKDQTVFDESLQGSSFNTPKPQRKIKKDDNQEEESTSEEETSEEESSEDETETESSVI